MMHSGRILHYEVTLFSVEFGFYGGINTLLTDFVLKSPLCI